MREEYEKGFVDRVVDVVAEVYLIKPEDIFGASRLKRHVEARQLVMVLCRDIGKMTFQEIARGLNRSDHQTVINGIKRFTSLRERRLTVENHARRAAKELRARLDALENTEGIWVPLSAPAIERLSVLVESGCFGSTASEAASRLLSAQLYELVGEIRVEVEE